MTSKTAQVISLMDRPLYAQRLAAVYLEKHRSFGYDVAKEWYYGFIPEEMQQAVTDAIKVLVGNGR